MEKEIIQKRVSSMIKLMKKNNIDFYLVPSFDYHLSEYVAPHFQHRQFLSGFTGSAGTLLFIKEADGAMLWTDGRYKIQAARQINSSVIQLNCTSDSSVVPIDEFIRTHMKTNTKIGCDGRCISMKDGLIYEKMIKRKGQKFDWKLDLASKLYHAGERPTLENEKLFILEEKYTGRPCSEKIRSVYDAIGKRDADCTYISSLDDIAWILNLRGYDIPNSPLFMSYLYISKKKNILFINSQKLSSEVTHYLKKNNIIVAKYEMVFAHIKAQTSKVKIFLDPRKTSYALYKSIKSARIAEGENPSFFLKSIKTEEELASLRKCHIKDGVAIVKTIKEIMECIANRNYNSTELDVVKSLHNNRKLQDGFIMDSFESIVAYKEHAAMMHYVAKDETNYSLENDSMLLIDSGGHYLDGTTDTTRTLVLGPISKNQKRDFTLALKGLIAVSSLRFLQGCTGQNLDILARYNLWNLNIDYKCGTGHGIGYLLNVHEGPNGFRWNVVKERNDSGTLLENMVTSIEPGVYIENEYGLRHENNIVVVKDLQNEYGNFLKFENLTMVPFDINGIDSAYLSPQEKNYLNEYHDLIRRTLEPYLSEDENKWLEGYAKHIE